MSTIEHYINDQRVSRDDRYQDVYNPATGEVTARVALASRQTVGEAVQMTAARTLTTTAIRTAGKFLGSRDGQKLIRGVLGSLLGGGNKR